MLGTPLAYGARTSFHCWSLSIDEPRCSDFDTFSMCALELWNDGLKAELGLDCILPKASFGYS
jgi:hypothetical protein